MLFELFQLDLPENLVTRTYLTRPVGTYCAHMQWFNENYIRMMSNGERPFHSYKIARPDWCQNQDILLSRWVIGKNSFAKF